MPSLEPIQKRVPAVQNALAILELLRLARNEPHSLSSIARATGINTSTCFNILKTLEAGNVVSFEPDTKTYQLGLYLAELGALVDEDRESRRLAMDEARLASDRIGLGCFLMTLNDREEFVVLDKVDSRQPIRITIDVGASFPATGAVAVKAWYAWEPDEITASLIRRHGLPGHTEHSITDEKVFRHELELVRERGYSTSVEEYYPGHNSVAAPVFGMDGRPKFLFVVVGTVHHMSGVEMDRVGREITLAAHRATERLGGDAPEGWPPPSAYAAPKPTAKRKKTS